MNQNLTHRQHLEHAGEPPALRSEPLVQTSEGARERLARQILAASGPMMNPARHQHYLLTLHVDVLQQRLEILVSQQK